MLRSALRIAVFAVPRTAPLRLASSRVPEAPRSSAKDDDTVVIPEKLMVMERGSVPEQRLLPAKHGKSWILIWHSIVHYLPMSTLIVAAILVAAWEVYYKAFFDVTSEGWWGRHHVHMEPKEYLEPHKAEEAERKHRHAPGPPEWITERFMAWAGKTLPITAEAHDAHVHHHH